MASKLGDANALVAEGEGARRARDDAELKLQAMGEARMRNVAAIEALDDKLAEETRAFALEVADRGAFALASIKTAFAARHGGVGGLSRMAHDLLLRGYLNTAESKELGAAFREKRDPDTSTFGH